MWPAPAPAACSIPSGTAVVHWSHAGLWKRILEALCDDAQPRRAGSVSTAARSGPTDEPLALIPAALSDDRFRSAGSLVAY
jgi:transposase